MLENQDIIYLGSADWDGVWVNSQHMAYRLAEKNRVLYLNSLGLRSPSLSTGDAGKVLKRLRSIFAARLSKPLNDRSLWVHTPLLLPWHGSSSIRKLNQKILLNGIRNSAKELGFEKPILWIFLPTAADLIGHLDEKLTVYYCVDAYAENPGVNKEAILEMENRILAKADIVFTTSKPLREDKAKSHSRVLYTPNCADVELYDHAYNYPAMPEELKNIPRPILGFAGNISNYKIDLDLLTAAAKAQSNWQFVLIGPIGHGDPATDASTLFALKNVHTLGPKKREELANYVAHFDVGLIPNRLNDSTRGSFPMKFYEYMAAKIPIVSTPLPSLLEYQGRDTLCRFAKGKDEFISACRDALMEGQSPEAVESRTKESSQHGWDQRMALVEGEIEKILKGK